MYDDGSYCTIYVLWACMYVFCYRLMNLDMLVTSEY